jgi:hypothetical protein
MSKMRIAIDQAGEIFLYLQGMFQNPDLAQNQTANFDK